jgi:hypothetical protein
MTGEQLIEYLVEEFRNSPALVERILSRVREQADPIVQIIDDTPNLPAG